MCVSEQNFITTILDFGFPFAISLLFFFSSIVLAAEFTNNFSQINETI